MTAPEPTPLSSHPPDAVDARPADQDYYPCEVATSGDVQLTLEEGSEDGRLYLDLRTPSFGLSTVLTDENRIAAAASAMTKLGPRASASGRSYEEVLLSPEASLLVEPGRVRLVARGDGLVFRAQLNPDEVGHLHAALTLLSEAIAADRPAAVAA